MLRRVGKEQKMKRELKMFILVRAVIASTGVYHLYRNGQTNLNFLDLT